MDDHHTHKHAEEDEGGKQDENDGESPAQSKIPVVQMLLQVCPAINLLRQGRVYRMPQPSGRGSCSPEEAGSAPLSTTPHSKPVTPEHTRWPGKSGHPLGEYFWTRYPEGSSPGGLLSFAKGHCLSAKSSFEKPLSFQSPTLYRLLDLGFAGLSWADL